MALARIITRSNPCSRQLALDLLGRGYAVEIVSPDSIPDNLADLELRVEEDPGNQLVASVEAHSGARSASLEFVHYLKAPMPDFIRKRPETDEAIRLTKEPASINVEQSVGEAELPATVPQPAVEIVSPAADILTDSKPVPEPELEKGAHLILPHDPLPSLPSISPDNVAPAPAIAQPTTFPATADPITARTIAVRPATDHPVTDRPTIVRPVTGAPTIGLPRDVQSPWESYLFDYFTRPFRSVALPLASLALTMALLFGFGTRRSGKPAVKSSRVAQAASIPGVSIVSEKASAIPLPPAAANAGGPRANAAKEWPVAKIDNPTAKAPTNSPTNAPTTAVGNGVSRRHRDGSIARDTVTYFDRSTSDESASRTTSPQNSAQRPVSRQQDGVMPANTATNLNNDPVPKAAKPDSDIKRYSDLK